MNSEDEKNQAVLTAFKKLYADGQTLRDAGIPATLGGATLLSNEEAIEFITRPIYYMGFPNRLPAKARGRKPARTQYDLAYERRKGLYQKLVRLPQSRIKAADARRMIGNTTRDLILRIAAKLAPTTPRHKLASEILRYLHKHPHLPQSDATTVRRIIKESIKSLR